MKENLETALLLFAIPLFLMGYAFAVGMDWQKRADDANRCYGWFDYPTFVSQVDELKKQSKVHWEKRRFEFWGYFSEIDIENINKVNDEKVTWDCQEPK